MFRPNTNPRPLASPYFPTFLLPSIKIPFVRRRQSSATTATRAAFEVPPDVPSLSSSPTTTTSTDDFPVSPTDSAAIEVYDDYIHDDKMSFLPSPSQKQPLRQRRASFPRHRLARALPDILRCNTCGTDVAYGLQIVSKGFTGRYGRALLVAAPSTMPTPSCPASPLPNSSVGSNSSISPGHHALAQESANLVNITVGRPEPRNLVTGAHVVADINCTTCGVKIGWKYVDAREQAQKYKVGKFILETERVVLLRTWEDVPADKSDDLSRHFYSMSAPVGSPGKDRRRSSTFLGGRKPSYSSEGPGCVEEDEEDECEDNGESSSGETDEEIAFDSEDEDECEDIFAGVWDAATVARRRNSRASAGSHHNAKKSRAVKGGR